MASTAVKGKIRGKRYTAAKVMAGRSAVVLNAVEQGNLTLTAFEYIAESLNCMGEALKVFTEYARSLDPKKHMTERLEAYDHVLHAAAMLAPYRYPKYATIKINNTADRGPLVADDVTYEEVMADLAEHIRTTGVWPRKTTDAVKNGQLASSKPKPPPPRPPRPPPPPPPP